MSDFADDVLGIDPGGGGIVGLTPWGLGAEAVEDWMTDDDAADAQKEQNKITQQQLTAAQRAQDRADETWNFWKDNYGQKEIDFAAKTFGYDAADLKAGLDNLDALAAQRPDLQGLRARSIVSGQDYLNESTKPIDYYETNPLQYETEAGRASAEVQQAADRERQAANRRLLSRGINPNSGAALEFDRMAGLQTSANKVFAANAARNTARDAGYNRRLTDYDRRIKGMRMAGDADNEEFNRGLSLAGEKRAGNLDAFNKAATALNNRRGASQDVFNRNLATFQLGRGLQPTSIALSNQAMGGLQSASNAYGAVANRPNPAMQDLMAIGQLAGTAYGLSK